MKKHFLLLTILVLSLSAGAFADTAAKGTAGSSGLGLFKEEQMPLSANIIDSKAIAPASHARELFLLTLVFGIAGVGSWFAFRTLKSKGVFKGSRRYLIEQLSYCSLGGKSGVGLLKVGSEFVLVGVTPQQVSFLSRLPGLEAQYAEEAGLERAAFKEAVREELTRIEAKGVA